MDDKANIQSAYNNAVQGIFKVFFEDLAAADGDVAAEATAQTEFKAGLNIARKALAAALTLI